MSKNELSSFKNEPQIPFFRLILRMSDYSNSITKYQVFNKKDSSVISPNVCLTTYGPPCRIKTCTWGLSRITHSLALLGRALFLNNTLAFARVLFRHNERCAHVMLYGNAMAKSGISQVIARVRSTSEITICDMSLLLCHCITVLSLG